MQASERIKAKLGQNDLQVAVMLHKLGVCLRDAKRYDEAEELLKHALEIKKAKLGEDDLQVAYTLQTLASVHGNQGDTTRWRRHWVRHRKQG